jgi:hypothetical protein
MFTIEQIESLFGQETRKYLQNKNRGGINGERKSTLLWVKPMLQQYLSDSSLIFGRGSNIGINSNTGHAYNAEDRTG